MERAMINWWYMRVDPHVGRDASRWKFCHQCRSICRGVCERPPQQSLDPVGNALALRLWSFGTLFFADPTQTPVDATLKLDTLIDWTPFLELFEYDRDRRPAARLARTVHVVRLVRACHWQLDAAGLKEFGLQPDVNQWVDQLTEERKQRVINLREIGVEQPEDPDESIELQTLLLHSFQSASGETVLMPEERNLMDVFYKSLVKGSGVMVLTVPEWFVPRHDVDAKLTQWLGSTVDICELEGADANEEAVVHQATLWSAVNHPHVAKLWGACHVGATRFVIQEPTVPLAKVPDASWTVWRDCALGLCFLFECGLPHEVFSHELIAKIHDRPKFVLLARGLVCRPRDEFLALFVANARVFAELIAAWRQRTDQQVGLSEDKVEAAYQQVETSNQQHIRGIELSERPESWTNAEWSLYDRLHTCDANNVYSAIAYATIGLQDIVELKREQSTSMKPDDIQACAASSLDSLKDHYSTENRTDVESAALANLYDHLIDVYDLILQLDDAMKTPALYAFSRAVDRFKVLTEKINDAMQASSTLRIANQQVAALQFIVDDLMAMAGVPFEDSLVRLTESSTADSRTADDQLNIYGDILRHFEATKRTGYHTSLDMSDTTTFGQDSCSFPPFPRWFIPPYELEAKFELPVTGGYGKVWNGRWFGMEVIMKRLKADPNADPDNEFQKTFAHEADIWFSLNHPNIARLYGACHIGKTPYYVCEFAEKGTLTEFLDQSHDREGWVWHLLLGAARGLQYIHELGIVHKDLKCDNILVSEDIRAWLADFGMSESIPQAVVPPTCTGAYRWRAPEVLRGECASSASDVFSFGMCIVEAVTGSFPWGNMPDVAVGFHVRRGTLLTKPSNLNDDAWAIVSQMNKSDPADRIEMPRAVQLLEGMVRSQ